ncbi:hypothetical protein LDC_1839 [sediment metagenome]|uniref:Uncharacterized protein n=1 Tax=sediment metagenome TaxID=749907 RepID=D9PJX6_9ZZZZ
MTLKKKRNAVVNAYHLVNAVGELKAPVFNRDAPFLTSPNLPFKKVFHAFQPPVYVILMQEVTPVFIEPIV